MADSHKDSAPATALNSDELDAVEAIFRRYIGEDDAISPLQDLVADGFVIVNERSLAETIKTGFERLLAMPVEERMGHMGMVAISVEADDGEAVDVWIERGDETDGGY